MAAEKPPAPRVALPIVAGVVCLATLCAFAPPASAQLKEGIESWADAMTGVSNVRWAGERVPYPDPEARPEGLLALHAWTTPVSLHVPPGMPESRVRGALNALADAHALLEEVGWELRAHDGGLGGGAGLDVYLVEDLPEGARAGVDAVEPVTYLDSASSFGLADARVPNDRLAACATSAFVQAIHMRHDPAEAESVRRSVGAYVAWLVTGELGCDDAPLRLWSEPERSFMGEEPDAAGAAFWALLGSRQDRNAGAYLREIWQVARQRTWEGDDLRASPDTWEALDTVLKVHREEFPEVMDELAVARFTQGQALLSAGTPRLSGEYAFGELPLKTRPAQPALETLGSAYYVVNTPGVDAQDTLRLWLRGEYGVRWALSVLRLDAQGRDLGRVSAPARDYPRSYLALTLTPDTARVLIVLTNLSSRLPDADAPDDNVRSAHLVLDRGAEAMDSAGTPPPAPGGAGSGDR